MDATRAFREEFARRVRRGVRRYLEENDLWKFGPTDLAKLIRAEGVSCSSWTVEGWLKAEYVPKYEMGKALARALDLDYDEMMAPVADPPQSAEDAPGTAQTMESRYGDSAARVGRGKGKDKGKKAS